MSFCSLPIPVPGNICLITCLLISSLPEPFPDNSVLSFVWICLVSIHACPRLRLLPAPPVPQHPDSRFRPTPVHWTSDWITLIVTVYQRTILDCCFSLDVHFNKEHHFFAPEFCLAISSYYRSLTERSSHNGSSGPNSGSASATRISVGTTSRRNPQSSPGNGGHPCRHAPFHGGTYLTEDYYSGQPSSCSRDSNAPECQSFFQFSQAMRDTFDRSVSGPAATRQLFRIRQGQRSISDYAIEFRTLAASAGWGEQELHGAYFNGLSERLLDELNTCELPTSLNALIDLTLRIDTRLTDRQAARHSRETVRPREVPRTRNYTSFRPMDFPEPEPMQVGRTRLPFDERQRRRERHPLPLLRRPRTFNCQMSGKRQCPSVSKGILTGATFEPHPPTSQSSLSARITWRGTQLQVPVLLDSGADASFICPSLVKKMEIATVPLASPMRPCALTGASLPEVMRVTEPVKISISGNHQEEMVFLVMRSPRFPLVLGKLWLRKHNPQVDWVRGLITGWNPECHSTCLLSATTPATTSNPTTYPPPDLSSVPKEYHDLGEVFSKSKATSLPPHRSYDCAPLRHQPSQRPTLLPVSTRTTRHGQVHRRMPSLRSHSSIIITCRSWILFCQQKGRYTSTVH